MDDRLTARPAAFVEQNMLGFMNLPDNDPAVIIEQHTVLRWRVIIPIARIGSQFLPTQMKWKDMHTDDIVTFRQFVVIFHGIHHLHHQC